MIDIDKTREMIDIDRDISPSMASLADILLDEIASLRTQLRESEQKFQESQNLTLSYIEHLHKAEAQLQEKDAELIKRAHLYADLQQVCDGQEAEINELKAQQKIDTDTVAAYRTQNIRYAVDLAQARRQIEAWKADAERYAKNVDFWKKRCEKLEAAFLDLFPRCIQAESMQAGEGYIPDDFAAQEAREALEAIRLST